MKLPQPVTIDGEVFTHVNINLAIDYRSTTAEDGDATVAMRLVPVRFSETGEAVVSENKAIGKMLGSLSEAGPISGKCASTVYTALQSYIVESGVMD
mgnify:CR=1 FL=1